MPIWHLKNTRVRKKDGRGGRRTILIVLGVVLLVIGMMVTYTKIESKYKV